MQNLEPQKLVEASPVFRGLQPEEVAAITERLQPAHFKRGVRIMERGVWHGQLHIIADGQVSVLLQEGTDDVNGTMGAGNTSERGLKGAKDIRNMGGKGAINRTSTSVAQLGPGECFGEMSLITGELPTATIRAEQDTMLWSLPQADFLALMGSCPTLLQNINAILSRRLARTNQQILADSTAEWVWLALVDERGASPVERSLTVHIADALAARTFKRVLMLEFCGQDEALGPHFARYTGQMRPDLVACTRDSNKLQAHRAPTVSSEGEQYAAFADRVSASDEAPTEDRASEAPRAPEDQGTRKGCPYHIRGNSQ